MLPSDVLEHLDGHVALVTGANRGLGDALTTGLAALGARVFAGARDPATVRARENVTPVRLDVTRDEDVRAVMARARDDAGRLDVLVNNAGAPPAFGHDFLTEPDASVDATLAVDVRGTWRVTRAALPLLFEREGGRVVNVSAAMAQLTQAMGGETGDLARSGRVEAPAYRVAKAAVNALTVYLHHEYHEAHGLIANAFTPGWVRTRMGSEAADVTPEEGADTGVWLARFAPPAPGGLFWRERAVIPW